MIGKTSTVLVLTTGAAIDVPRSFLAESPLMALKCISDEFSTPDELRQGVPEILKA